MTNPKFLRTLTSFELFTVSSFPLTISDESSRPWYLLLPNIIRVPEIKAMQLGRRSMTRRSMTRWIIKRDRYRSETDIKATAFPLHFFFIRTSLFEQAFNVLKF